MSDVREAAERLLSEHDDWEDYWHYHAFREDVKPLAQAYLAEHQPGEPTKEQMLDAIQSCICDPSSVNISRDVMAKLKAARGKAIDDKYVVHLREDWQRLEEMAKQNGHQPDDGEEATTEWMLGLWNANSSGQPETEIRDNASLWHLTWVNSCVVLSCGSDGDALFYRGIVLLTKPARGDVRSLLRALGITTTV